MAAAGRGAGCAVGAERTRSLTRRRRSRAWMESQPPLERDASRASVDPAAPAPVRPPPACREASVGAEDAEALAFGGGGGWRRSKVTNSRELGSCSAATRAAPMWSASELGANGCPRCARHASHDVRRRHLRPALPRVEKCRGTRRNWRDADGSSRPRRASAASSSRRAERPDHNPLDLRAAGAPRSETRARR